MNLDYATRSTFGPDQRTQALIELLSCGPGGNRTHDLRIKSPLLYRLSYRPAAERVVARETVGSSVARDPIYAPVSIGPPDVDQSDHDPG